MQYFHASDKGNHHEKNEDQFIEKKLDNISFFAVADGVGGLPYGDIASKLAVQPFVSLSTPPSSLESLFHDANELILKESEQKNRLIGSTLVTAMINLDTKDVFIAHIGDSRAYIFSGDGMWHTKDDTLVQELVEMGIFTEEQAFSHPNKNRLNKALGTCEDIHVESYNAHLKDHSVLLLCTDGLHDYVRDEDIKIISMTEAPEKAAEKLVKKARENGSTDDITIIIVSNM
jgi:PPM family protein phosphatase